MCLFLCVVRVCGRKSVPAEADSQNELALFLVAMAAEVDQEVLRLMIFNYIQPPNEIIG